MRVIFLSTQLTPHQIPLCSNLCEFAEEFYFIQTKRKGHAWESKGQIICRDDYGYLVDFYENRKFCEDKLLEADVVIVGGVDLAVLRKRLELGKLVFVYSERFYKNGITFKNLARTLFGTYLHHGRYQKYKPYLLCASAYCAADAGVFGNYRGRALKWGYFPTTKNYSDIAKLLETKKQNSIVWAARCIGWKHPEVALQIAQRLRNDGYEFTLDMIGDGELLEKIRNDVILQNLSDCVRVHGAQSSSRVREYMEKSEIFLFTSDRNEGWGVVLNEAMNSACAVVASHAIGAAPFMVEDGVNGLLYCNGDIEDLYCKVKSLFNNPEEKKELASNAYITVIEEWNAEIAAKKLLALAETMLEKGNKFTHFESGICSRAEILKDNWYKNE